MIKKDIQLVCKQPLSLTLGKLGVLKLSVALFVREKYLLLHWWRAALWRNPKCVAGA
jgi:hypothetical protein